MAGIIGSNDAFVVKEGEVYYVVESIRRYDPGSTSTGLASSQGYQEIDTIFKNGNKLNAVRVKFEVVSQHSAHTGRQ